MLRARKKLSKKELKHDPMLESIFRVETFFKTYSKQSLYGFIAIIGLVVVSIILMNSKSEAEVDAASAVGIAQFRFMAGDYQDAIVRLEDALRKYPGTKAASEGTFYLGSANYQAGNKDDAEKSFRNYLEGGSDDPILAASAYAGIAAVREDMFDYAEAAENYKKAVLRTDSQFQIEMYTISAVRNYHKAGNSEIALNLIKDMLADKKTSFEAKSSLEYLESVISNDKG